MAMLASVVCVLVAADATTGVPSVADQLRAAQQAARDVERLWPLCRHCPLLGLRKQMEDYSARSERLNDEMQKLRDVLLPTTQASTERGFATEADPTLVNGQITDAVTQSNTDVAAAGAAAGKQITDALYQFLGRVGDADPAQGSVLAANQGAVLNQAVVSALSQLGSEVAYIVTGCGAAATPELAAAVESAWETGATLPLTEVNLKTTRAIEQLATAQGGDAGTLIIQANALLTALKAKLHNSFKTITTHVVDHAGTEDKVDVQVAMDAANRQIADAVSQMDELIIETVVKGTGPDGESAIGFAEAAQRSQLIDEAVATLQKALSNSDKLAAGFAAYNGHHTDAKAAASVVTEAIAKGDGREARAGLPAYQQKHSLMVSQATALLEQVALVVDRRRCGADLVGLYKDTVDAAERLHAGMRIEVREAVKHAADEEAAAQAARKAADVANQRLVDAVAAGENEADSREAAAKAASAALKAEANARAAFEKKTTVATLAKTAEAALDAAVKQYAGAVLAARR